MYFPRSLIIFGHKKCSTALDTIVFFLLLENAAKIFYEGSLDLGFRA